jgi:DNA-binding NtrC family response regulator
MSVPELDTAAADSLRAYPWLGNVGELKNVADRLVMFARGNYILLDDLPLDLRVAPMVFASSDDSDKTVADAEKAILRRALARANGRPDQAAGMLGLPEPIFNLLIKRYNIDSGAA